MMSFDKHLRMQRPRRGWLAAFSLTAHRHPIRFHSARFYAFLCCLVAGPLVAAENSSQEFDRRLKAGEEVATVLENSSTPGGDLAVIFTARKKSLKSAKWPLLIRGVTVNETDATDENLYSNENWLVSLKNKVRLGQVRSSRPGFGGVYDGLQLNQGVLGNGFSALWGPEQKGGRYGLLNYKARWGCAHIFLVDSNGTMASVASIRNLLQAAVRKFVATQRKKGPAADACAVGYTLLEAKNPDASVIG